MIEQNTGIISPNAPRKIESQETERDTPTDEEEKLCKQIDLLFEKSVKHRKKYDHCWAENYKMFKGDQWIKRRPSYKSKEIVNLIFQTIQSQSSVMLDTRPTVGFLPQEPTDIEIAEILNKVFESDWERNNWLDELTAQIYDGHIYSVGYTYSGFNEEENSIEYCAKDPFNFYPDPQATNVNKKGRYFLDVEPMDLEEVKRKYAGHKYVNLIKPDLEDVAKYKKHQETLHRRRNTDLDMPAGTNVGYSNSADDSRNNVLVITAYLKPNDTEQIEKEELNDKGESEIVYITRKKYPRGRKVVKINNYIFEDEGLEYDHLEFPFERYVNYVLPREFFGISEVDNTKGPQMVFNRLINYALDVLILMGNPVYMVPIEGDVNTRKLTGEPGLVVEYANGAKPTREEGVQLQPYVLQLIDRMEKWFNDEAGTQDVTRGINPTGVTANAAIENLLEAAEKRIKQKMRNLDSCLKDFGRHWVSLCFQYYTAPRIYRITNKEGVNSYFKFHVEQRPMIKDGKPVLDAAGIPKNQKFAIIRDYAPDQNGQMLAAERNKEYEIRGSFDVRVNTISGLPFSKASNEQKVLNLFDRGIIDDEEVLTRLEYPNKETVLQRVRQRAAEAAAAQPQPPMKG